MKKYVVFGLVAVALIALSLAFLRSEDSEISDKENESKNLALLNEVNPKLAVNYQKFLSGKLDSFEMRDQLWSYHKDAVENKKWEQVSQILLVLTDLIRDEGIEKDLVEFEEMVFKYFTDPQFDGIPVRAVLKKLEENYVSKKLRPEFFKLYEMINAHYLKVDLKNLSEQAKSFSNDIEVIPFFLHYLNREEYIGEQTRRIVESESLFEKLDWMSEKFYIELVTERATAQNMMGDYESAKASLGKLEIPLDPQENKQVFKYCYAYLEYLDLKTKQESLDSAILAMDEYIEATKNPKDKFEKNCRSHGFFLKALVLVSQDKAEEAQAVMRLNNSVQSELSSVFTAFVDAMIAVRSLDPQAYKLIEDVDALLFYVWTRNDLYVARELLIASIFRKDQFKFELAIERISRVYKLRWENKRHKDLNDAWILAGKRYIFNEQINKEEIELKLSQVEDLVGRNYLGVREIRGFIDNNLDF